MTQGNVSERLAIAARQNTKERKFWTKQLSGNLVKTGFPYDNHKINVNEYEYNIESKTFQLGKNRDGELFSRLLELSKGSDYTLNLVLITAIILLLNKYSGNKDIIVGTPIYKQNVEGEFINTVLILRNPLENNHSFKELLLQVRQTIREAVENKNYPIELLVEMENLQVEGFDKGPSLFDVVILLENIHKKEYLQHVNCNMTFSFTRQENSIKGVVEYNSSLYEKTTIENIIAHFTNLLQNIFLNLDLQLSQLEMLTGEEKRKILYDFNRTRWDYPKEKTVYQWFTEQADRTPHHVAVSAPIDLTGIYDQLESEILLPTQEEKIGACCFKQNPYTCQYTLKLSTGDNHTRHLNILKTHRHNSVIINKNLSKLLAYFDGNKNLRSIYSLVKKIEKPEGLHQEFLILSMNRVDLLEVSFQLNRKPEIFTVHDFKDLLKLIRCLYRNHLIELAGIAPGESFFEVSLVRDLAEDKGQPLIEEFTPENIMAMDKEKGTAEVLLLGDTPGTSSTGLLYLASYLRRKGIKVLCQYYDPSRNYSSMKQNIETLLEYLQPAIVAISLKWFLYIARVLDMGKIVKEYARKNSLDIKVVVGGNTASYYWEKLVTFDCIDVLVRGDGEKPLVKICRGEDVSHIPNCAYKKDGTIIENPVSYVQDETNSSDIFLSHLEEILLSPHASYFGTFYIYTVKGCFMNCLYCGGCKSAQQKTFNRKTVFKRGIKEVRKDILEAQPYASTFHFEFDIPDKNIPDYCRQIWAGIDLSRHFCVFSTLTPPSAALVELVSRTFKYVYWDFDICTFSQRHRMQLFSLGLVKPQPSDKDILDFMDRCEKYRNIEVRLNLITGLPYFTEEDIEPGEKLLYKIMNDYSCFGELHWARLHAQPGAPIIETAGKHNMHSYATTFEDFLKYSQENFNPSANYSTIEDLNYPYIYFNDNGLNSRITNLYLGINKKVDQHRIDVQRGMIVCDTLTYRELNEKAGQTSNALRAMGVRPGKIVGLMLERSLQVPVGILGILKAGCTYMPIDPEFPGGRIEYMLKDSNAGALVTTPKLQVKAEVDERHVEIIDIAKLSSFSSSTLTSTYSSGLAASADNPAYVIYTSGTTGKPKGVLLKQKNLINYVHWFTTAANLTQKDKTVLTSSFAFDLGYTSLYTSLLNGGELHILPREIYLLGERLVDYFRQKQISYIKVTPSLFTVIVHSPNFSAKACKSLRTAAVGGEAINVEDIETAHNRCPHLQIMNHYGPTEATIGCVATFIDFNKFEAYKKHPVIGTPIHNTNVYILGKDLSLLPVGIPGELAIAGTCLARGYLNRPELTAERFIKAVIGHSSLAISFSEEISKVINDHSQKLLLTHRSSNSSITPLPHFPIYQTGDLARWLTNGTIEFLGRIDNQVKVMGYRIEPGEIEARLLEHSEIESTVVLVKERPTSREGENNQKGNKYLCAYFVPKAGAVRSKPTATPTTARNSSAEKEDMGNILSFVRAFEKTVKKDHDKIAVQSNGRVLTYGSLDQYASRVAGEILEEYDDTNSLSKNERLRYQRQMQLHGWGMASQEKLKGTRVFVAGAGGGASPTIMQLALAGFGTIIVCDDDVVEISNLNRQFLHDENRIGMNKALSARMTIKQVNPHVRLLPLTEKLTRENVARLVDDVSIIFDMFDGLEAKFILAEYALSRNIPHIISAMTDINAYTAVLHPPLTPCYHCIFDKNKWEEISVGMKHYVDGYEKNPLPVAATSLFMSTAYAVNEAIKILLGFDIPAYNKFFYFNQRGATPDLIYSPGYKAMTHLFSDHFIKICQKQGFDWNVGWRGNFLEELKIEPNPNCPLCGEKGAQKLKIEAIGPLEIKEKAKIKKPGGNKKKIVSLLLNHDIEMAAGLTAVLKSGMTYVPLDPTSSMQRLSDLLEESESRIILTDNRHFQLAEKIRNKVNKNIQLIDINRINTDEPGESNENLSRGNHTVEIEPGLPAYISFLPDSPGNGTPGFNTSLKQLYQALLEGNSPYSFEPEGSGNSNDSTTLSSKLRSYLLQNLPDYMIPSHFVRLENMPLTPNGKIDRKALPEPDTGATTGYIAPRNKIEEILTAIWSEVLGIEKDTISIDANFFSLGGHSLNATIMAAKIHEKLNIKVPLGDLFKTPTIKGLAGDMQVAEIHRHTSIEPIEEKEYYQLSSAQERIYVFQQMDLESTSYNMPLLLELTFAGDKRELSGSFNQLIKRHESLRTSFNPVNGEPVQRVHRDVEFEIKYYESDSLEAMGSSGDEIPRAQVEVELEVEEGTPKQAIEKIINNFFKAFDLSRAPLLQVGFLHLPTPGGPDQPGSRYFLMIDMHHIISDGFSLEILKNEFNTLYTGRELPPLRLQYKDYSEWQNNRMTGTMMIHQQEYWLRQFEGNISPLNFPMDYERPEIQSFDGDTLGFRLGKEETKALKKMVLEKDSTLFMILLAAYNIFLSKICRQEDIIIGTPIAGRGHSDLDQVIGMFVNVLAMRNQPNGSKTFEEFLREVKENALKAYENQDYQFDELVQKLRSSRNLEKTTLVETHFIMQNIDAGADSSHTKPMNNKDAAAGEMKKRHRKGILKNFKMKKTRLEMALFAEQEDEKILLHFAYMTSLFKKDTIEKFCRYFANIMKTIVKTPAIKINEIELLTEEEKNRMSIQSRQNKEIFSRFKEEDFNEAF